MTKQQWVSLIQDYLSGGECVADLRGKYHPVDIADYFSLVYSSLMYEVGANAIRYKDYAQFSPYIKAVKNVPILKDNDRNEYYSELPTGIIQLPENRGIRQISPMQDQRHYFYYLNTPDSFGTLESHKTPGISWFYVEGQNVFYRNIKKNYIDNGLLFKIISDLSGFDDTEEIGLPAQRATEVFTLVVNLLRARPLQKQSNDNTDTQLGGLNVK